MGEFNQIKQRFVINPALIGSQSSLNMGGSRRTRDFAQKLLNSFMIQSRVKIQRKNIGIYKEIMREKYMPFDTVTTDRRP